MTRRLITFVVMDQALWQHRGAGTWLEDLIRAAGISPLDVSVDAELADGVWTLEVLGTEQAHRFICVALNLHAETEPWDTTPPEQALALEKLWATPQPRPSTESR